jgi:neutral ceramidase
MASTLKDILSDLTATLGVVSPDEYSQFKIPFKRAKKSSPPQCFMAGAATVDITPPPGCLPRAGYATWSTLGQGFRTRLFARAYYLRDTQGNSHVIIQTDLTSGSRILHTKLGAVLAETTDIDASNLTLTAVHSHSAPGQIVGSQFYNKHISNKPGFAHRYFDFLVERISGAVKEAIDSQKPAKLATGAIDIWGLTRNRSIQAHVENLNCKNKSTEDERTFHSVNPTLYMVRIDSQKANGRFQPLGAFASFSIHGTALPERERLFNADVWAYIHKDWQHDIERTYQPDQPVHVSGFEGTHGDVSPASRFGMLGYIEARRVGESIAKRAISLYHSLDDQLTDQVKLRSAIRYINIRFEPQAGHYCIDCNAAAGMTLAAAPLEHSSPVIGKLPFFKQGSRKRHATPGDPQGRKRVLGFRALQPKLEPPESFPDYVNFQLLQINDLLMVPMPFEYTTESGYRLAQALRQCYEEAGQGDSIKHVMVTSLAGGYTGYVTTPEEYGRQYYEGGHTIYGEQTQPYLTEQTRKLAQTMLSQAEEVVELPEHWTYQFQVKTFLPDPMQAHGQRLTTRVPKFKHAQANEEGHWYFYWLDVNPSKIALHFPLLSIETRKDGGKWELLVMDGIAVTDQEYDLSVELINNEVGHGMAEYKACWYNPLFDGENREYRFVIEPREQLDRFYSPAFH